MITIYLGDVSDYLRQQAIESDPAAQLIAVENYKNLRPGTYFTSLGELSNLTMLGEVLQQADCIVYSPPPGGGWSDCFFGKSHMQKWTEDYLDIFKFRCKIQNYNTKVPEFDQILTLADTRKTNSSQLWIAGCSITHGEGVSKNTRYGQLLAERLNTDVSFLTRPGSSIAWAADQILRSDIRSNDTVVWGLTAHARLMKFEMNKFKGFVLHSKEHTQSTMDYVTSDQALYHSVIAVYQVINFCAKIHAKLILASVFDRSVVDYIQDFPNLVMLNGLWGRDIGSMFMDLGSDSIHPGIKTHEFYADQIYQKIQNSVAIE